jgi:hypothetical protein
MRCPDCVESNEGPVFESDPNCGTCDGKGLLWCDVCGATEAPLHQYDAAPATACPPCKGMGRVPKLGAFHDIQTCVFCSGRGTTPVGIALILCKSCDEREGNPPARVYGATS